MRIVGICFCIAFVVFTSCNSVKEHLNEQNDLTVFLNEYQKSYSCENNLYGTRIPFKTLLSIDNASISYTDLLHNSDTYLLYVPQNYCFACLEEQINNLCKYLHQEQYKKMSIIVEMPHSRNVYNLLKKNGLNIEIFTCCDSVPVSNLYYFIDNPVYFAVDTNSTIIRALRPITNDTISVSNFLKKIR